MVVKAKRGTKLDPLMEEADELYDSDGFSGRRDADLELEQVFRDGRFTGRLYKALGLNIKSASTSYLLVNLVRSQVIDRSGMLSMLPDPKFDVPFTADEAIALTEQNVLTHLQETLWDYWRIKRIMHTNAFNLALKNRALWLLYPDFEAKKPMMYALDPSSFYAAENYRGEFSRVFLIDRQKGRRIRSEYGRDVAEAHGVDDPNNDYYVHWFFDDKERRIFINQEEITQRRIEHNLGFVPVRYTQDTHIPGSVDNLGSAFHAIAAAENFTDVLKLTSAEMRKGLNSIPWYTGDIDPVDAKAAYDGKAMLGLPEGGKFGVEHQMQGQVGAHQHLKVMDDLFRVVTNWPRLRSGQISSSIWTERGIDAAQSAVSDDILNVRETIADDLEWLDTAAIHMLKKMWGKDEHDLLVFEQENVKGTVKIVPNLDIPNDFKHELVVFPLAHDVTGKAVLLMQLHGAKLYDTRSVLEQLPGVNPGEVMRRLDEDLAREVKQQIALQQALAPPEQAAPGGAPAGAPTGAPQGAPRQASPGEAPEEDFAAARAGATPAPPQGI